MSTHPDVHINQSVAILIDGNNIERGLQKLAKDANALLDFDKMVPKLLQERGLKRLIYFREGISISDKLAQRLLTNFHGSVVPCHKSADIPLTIMATQIAQKVDTIIILSGDSDYVELVRHLKGEGVRVEIAAVQHATARILVDEVEHFTPITLEDCYILKVAGRSTGKSRSTTTRRSSSNTQTSPDKSKPAARATNSAEPKTSESASDKEKSKPAPKRQPVRRNTKAQEASVTENKTSEPREMEKSKPTPKRQPSRRKPKAQDSPSSDTITKDAQAVTKPTPKKRPVARRKPKPTESTSSSENQGDSTGSAQKPAPKRAPAKRRPARKKPADKPEVEKKDDWDDLSF